MDIIVTLVGFIAGIIAIISCWGKASNFFFNRRNFKRGGFRITYVSKEYKIFSGDLDSKKLVFASSTQKSDYILYRGEGMYEHIEEIKPFNKWRIVTKFDDICSSYYRLQNL